VVKIEVTNLNNYMNKTAKTSELGRPDKCWRIWQIKKKITHCRQRAATMRLLLVFPHKKISPVKPLFKKNQKSKISYEIN
jgi:hypothetical protein